MCTNAVWSNKIKAMGNSFYISDNSGISINFCDLIINDNETISWTLENYIRISSKYPSKTRLYSVKQVQGVVIIF